MDTILLNWKGWRKASACWRTSSPERSQGARWWYFAGDGEVTRPTSCISGHDGSTPDLAGDPESNQKRLNLPIICLFFRNSRHAGSTASSVRGSPTEMPTPFPALAAAMWHYPGARQQRKKQAHFTYSCFAPERLVSDRKLCVFGATLPYVTHYIVRSSSRS